MKKNNLNGKIVAVIAISIIFVMALVYVATFDVEVAETEVEDAVPIAN